MNGERELPSLRQMHRRAAESVTHLVATITADGALTVEARDDQDTPLARTTILNARDARALIDCTLRSSPIDRFSGFSTDADGTRAAAGLRLHVGARARPPADRANGA